MRKIHGPRPPPLKICKTSHLLQKQQQHHRHRRRQPVIIYTHSPKIIHTQPRDFMALVQKLTGFSPSQRPQPFSSSAHSDGNSTPVDIAEDNINGYGSGAGDVVQGRSSSPSPRAPAKLNNLGSHYSADIPLFTPTSTDFFCSPRPGWRCPASSFTSPTLVSSMSPTLVEFLKGLPEF